MTITGFVSNLTGMAKNYDYYFQLLLVGDEKVGKSSIMSRFAKDIFRSTYTPTMGKHAHTETRTEMYAWRRAGGNQG